MTDQTIFERCAEAADDCFENDFDFPPGADFVRAVIQTIIDNTPSLRTAEELTRILGEA